MTTQTPCPDCGRLGSHMCKPSPGSPSYIKPPCTSPGHAPPTHLYVPPGSVYVHVCSACGLNVRLFGSGVTYTA